MRADLAQAYGQERLPRYTSYPTAPHFTPSVTARDYRTWLAALPGEPPASLYLHVPFCRSMCWYCGCHTTLTQRDDPVTLYAAALRSEAQMVAEAIGKPLPISHIAFGGGTPTMMSPDAFVDLMGALRFAFRVLPAAEIAIEIDPRTLTAPMIDALGHCGVNRASLGVQSFDPTVQRAINRVQSFDQTANAVAQLRRAGIGKINFDLLYGLPLQSIDSCIDTVAQCIALRPDRISVFGYAHMPSLKKHQRKIADHSLPDSDQRHLQSEAIARALMNVGYRRIGLDHFALPEDNLSIALQSGRLHRNFQGYTDDDATTLIGIGASAIGRTHDGFVQNAVTTRDYLACIAEGRLATAKGYRFTDDDRYRAELIERIMCDLHVDVPKIARRHGRDPQSAIIDRSRIARLVADGAITLIDGRLSMRDDAAFLVRSVASAFDAHLAQSAATHSRAV